MKKICILICACVFLFSSCASIGEGVNEFVKKFHKTDEVIALETFENVLAAIKDRDKAALKSLFSPKAVREAEDLDNQIEELWDFFQGEVLSYDNWGGPGWNGSFDHFKRQVWLNGTYDVETTEGIYHIATQEFPEDEFDSDNIGLYSFYIISEENWSNGFAYWGDGEWLPGVHIEYEYTYR